MVRYIGKCGSCKQTTARDYTDSVKRSNGRGGMYFRSINVYGRYEDERFIEAVKDFKCGACGEYHWNGKRVEGTKTDHVCDARCVEAKGFKCECSCGGEHHGKGFLVCS